jgi:hypothetical protein
MERQDPGTTSFARVGTTVGTSYTDIELAAGDNESCRVLVRDVKESLKEYSGVVRTKAFSTINPRNHNEEEQNQLKANPGAQWENHR